MKRFLSIIIFSFFVLILKAQITGEVLADDGYGIPYASVMYKGHHVAVASDGEGRFSIPRHEGWTLTFSSVGYKTQTVKVDAKTPNTLKITLKEDATNLGEVTVSSKRGKYRRKDNPAVELMRRVIAAKEKNDLANHDYYQYNKYQKISFAISDLRADDLQSGMFKNSKWLLDQVETSSYTNKLILPLSVDETVTQHIYRKDPRSEKDIVKGRQSSGVNNVLQTGELLNTMLKEVFTDVDIYDNFVRLLQYPFTSPIGETAISFYRYYIEDTVYVDRDLCYHLEFMPNNQQDFGFRGHLYVLADSTLHVKKCSLTIPHKSDVNFVRQMHIDQEFSKLDNGEWVLTMDDMWAELSVTGFLSEVLVVRNTRLSDYAFDELPKKLFKGRAKTRHESDAMLRDEAFWNQYRAVELTKSESSMDAFIHRMEQSKNYKWVILGVRALVENYVETGSSTTKSKFDIGPINTLISKNFVDGFRFRLSGRTTAALNPHLFWNGYIARGLDSKKTYYGSELTYSLNKKKNSSFEFPQRNIVFESSYDVMTPADKFLIHNKDNAFMAFRTQKVEQMYFYNRQKLSFIYESDWGLSFNASLKTESNETAGDLHFIRVSDGTDVGKIRTTEAKVGVRYCPGQTFVNTKQHRLPVNLDSPEFTLAHTMGFNHLLGGRYKLNFTEVGFYKRQWLGSWGYIDVHANAGAQWEKVPFPLLIMPPVNLSYFEHENTFSLMRNMEFLNDRYAFWSIAWDMNGKLLNRLPLIKHLKWREYIAFKGMFGKLTDKNNPFLEKNAGDDMLFEFPFGAHVMDSRTPYMEIVAGVHNIFKFFSIDFVHRFNYNGNEETKKNGVRFGFMISF
ncbi:MAG: carboxypeptidase-like regulatory domain-containing protein [Prevotella sp.]|nr:carboxypeptidase-like regulatory domain-containing protein [Prevotella sp.]